MVAVLASVAGTRGTAWLQNALGPAEKLAAVGPLEGDATGGDGRAVEVDGPVDGRGSPVAVTVQVKVVVAVRTGLPLSVTVTVTVLAPTVVGVPVIVPVVGAMARPAGRPVAEYVRVWPASGSVAVIGTGVMAGPWVEVRAPGLVIVGVWLVPPVGAVMVHVKVAVAVTGWGAVVGDGHDGRGGADGGGRAGDRAGGRGDRQDRRGGRWPSR